MNTQLNNRQDSISCALQINLMTLEFKFAIKIIFLLSLSTGCKTNNFNKITTDVGRELIITHNGNSLAYRAKLNIEKLSQEKGHSRRNIAINNIRKRSKSFSIIRILELMTKNERANFLRIYNGGNNTINSLLSQEFNHASLRKKAAYLIKDASVIPIKIERIIISDLDNTLRPTNDPSVDSYVYPGSVKLLKILDQKITGDVHIVTARPFGARNSLNSAGIQYNSISYGNVCGIAAWLLGFHNPIKDRKVENIRRIMDQNTKSSVVLIGDDGQADAGAYLQIMQEYPERVEAALIHNVIGRKLPEAFYASTNSIIYNDFEDAAETLYSRGIINKMETENIINSLRNQ